MIAGVGYCFVTNLTAWFVVYGTMYMVLFSAATPEFCSLRKWALPLKFNPQYPKEEFVYVEILRCISSVAVCTIYEVVIESMYDTGFISQSGSGNMFYSVGMNIIALALSFNPKCL